jgi:alkaline phosphatase
MMNKIIALLLMLLSVSCVQKPTQLPEGKSDPDIERISSSEKKARNIILMIGDGMGISQISAGYYSNGFKLNLLQCSHVGFSKTHSIDDLITDSAAAATAMATGVKTKNETVGMDAMGSPVTSILEEAARKGFQTGIVATASITHATPASFYAHQINRKMMEEIAYDLTNANLDFFVGGGKQYFVQRRDSTNLLHKLTEKGYVITDFKAQNFRDVQIDPQKKFGYLSADSEPEPYSKSSVYLADASRAALNHLAGRSSQGFFLVIEGSQIDWAGHANDFQYLLSELMEFDSVAGQMLDFAKANSETLVIIAGDHETGGLAINPGSTPEKLMVEFTTDGHTGVMIPVFAFGPGAEFFSGIYDNTEIHSKMKRALGF